MSATYDCADPAQRERGRTRAVAALKRGELVVLPTDTVYGIAADAFSPDAVAALLAAKGRGRQSPPPVLVPDARTLDGLATAVPRAVRELVEGFWPGALTVVCQAQPSLDWDLGDTGGTVAVRMPLHPVALELLAETGPLAVSSANRTGQPAARTCEEAEDQLGGSVAIYLDGGMTAGSAASTIVDGTSTPPRVLRLGALPVEALREVVPALLGPDDPAPQPEEEPDGREPEEAAS